MVKHSEANTCGFAGLLDINRNFTEQTRKYRNKIFKKNTRKDKIRNEIYEEQLNHLYMQK